MAEENVGSNLLGNFSGLQIFDKAHQKNGSKVGAGDIQAVNNKIEAYRRLAAARYRAKEEQFLRTINLKLDQNRRIDEANFEKFKQEFSKYVEEVGIAKWQKVAEEIKQNVTFEDVGNKGALTTVYYLKAEKEWTKEFKQIMSIPEYEQKIKSGASIQGKMDANGKVQDKVSKQFYHSMLGQLYEKFIMRDFASAAASTVMGSAYNLIFGNIMSTGQLTGRQHVRDNGEIIYDLVMGVDQNGGFYKDSKVFKNNGGFLGTASNQQLVVKQIINLDVQKLSKNYTLDGATSLQGGNATKETFTKFYLMNNLYGFGIKKYNIDLNLSSVRYKFCTATQLQKQINQAFKNKNIWNMAYAWAYTQLQVNRQVMELVGPNSIGQIFGNMFLWTSDLVENSMFLMDVNDAANQTVDDIEKNNLSVDQWSKPHIANSDVYFKYIKTKKITKLEYQVKQYQDKTTKEQKYKVVANTRITTVK